MKCSSPPTSVSEAVGYYISPLTRLWMKIGFVGWLFHNPPPHVRLRLKGVVGRSWVGYYISPLTRLWMKIGFVGWLFHNPPPHVRLRLKGVVGRSWVGYYISPLTRLWMKIGFIVSTAIVDEDCLIIFYGLSQPPDLS